MSDPPSPTPAPIRARANKLARVIIAAIAGAVAGIIAAFVAPWQAIPLLIWVVAAATWLGPMWITMSQMDEESTSQHATREDPRGPIADTLLVTASLASLVAVILGVLKAGHTQGAEKALLLSAGVAAIILSWGVVQTVFTLRYGALYYQGTDGGIDFNGDDNPTYIDFAYLAFTIGMTYQVSDTNLTAPAVRHTALRHGLLSYLFGTVIIATTINIAAGLAH
jgi:uncharacterized membrane protein